MNRAPLPIDDYLPDILRAIGESRSLVLVAEPGAGKTTRLPPAIYRSDLLSKEQPNIVMLQPRRVAARAAANRIAEENDWQLGREVGYHIRFEKRISPQTRLRVLTEGILTRQLLADPFLEGVGIVILDEFHERSIHSDLAVAMLREMRRTVRPDLILVIMSATLEAEKAAKFLDDCPIVRVPGQTFEIKIEYHPHGGESVVQRAVHAVGNEIVAGGPGKSSGDVLVFLPGADEIRRVMRQLEPVAIENNVALLPLHGSLPASEQTLALRANPRRKVILATNIAETSLTIDGVTVVIDSGLARLPSFDPHRGLDRLELKKISQASAAQRAGRAGRTAPGRCVRLWSPKEQAALKEFESPEIQRVDLCPVILDLHAWGKPDANQFEWFQPPPVEHISSAEQLLQRLGALENGQLSPIGKRLLKLPVHPRLGRMLLAAADFGCPDEGAELAAILSEKDFLRRPPPGEIRAPSVKGDSDLLLRLEILRGGKGAPNADAIALRQAAQAAHQLRQIARKLAGKSHHSPTHETLLKLPLFAYPDRVCRRRAGDRSAAAMVGGGGARLLGESIVRDAEYFLALDARHDPRSPTREAAVAIASAIRPEWLAELFPKAVRREQSVIFDPQKERIVGIDILRYHDLILAEETGVAVNGEQAGAALASALRPRAIEIFSADESAANVLARVALLRQFLPENHWPLFDENELGEILAELCAGKKSLEEVRRASLAAALENRLDHRLASLLRTDAPESIAVPSGSWIQLEYRVGHAPVLAVRLQEIFGWTDTPRVAAGRVRVLLHLLGPNFRPVQITDDLKSFWSTTYFQVRKDLRVRYPKHSWPENPLTAIPQAKGKPRRNSKR
jgi:ATP-dependent helicase HrpB